MYAIVKTGGKQYRVQTGQQLLVERLAAEAGAEVALEPLLYRDDDTVLDPAGLERVKVTAKVIEHVRGEKLRVFKFKPKRGYRRRTGHRQALTRIEVSEITAQKGKAGAAPTMTDDLIFTTTVTLQGTPRVVFAPVGTLLRVADASLDLNVGRSDKHEVTIGLAVDVAGVDSLRGFLFSAGRGSAGGAVIAGQRTAGRQRTGFLYAGQRVTGGGTPSEVLAVIAIDQQKSKEFRLQVQP